MRAWVAAAILIALAGVGLGAQAVPVQALPPPAPVAYAPTTRAQCFPIETLAPADRQLAEEWLASALDREGLFTLLAPIKPISSGVRQFKYSTMTPDLAELDQARRIAAVLRCGEGLQAMVQLFAQESRGERFAEILFINRAAFDAELRQHAPLFAARGLSPGVAPEQAMAIVEVMPRDDRFRALGHLFGFPEYAVEFFVSATTQNATNVGPGKDRDFYQVPAFKGSDGFFVWAVPLGHVERPEDRDIRMRAAPVLARYRELRDQFIGPGKPGVGELLRQSLCTPAGLCEAPAVP